MATSVTQGLSDDQTGGASYRIARRVTLADSMVVRAKLGPAGEGRILDISETGMASQSQIPIQPGGKITVDFDIPDGGHIRTEAQVVWRTVDKRMGLRFLRMSEPARLRLRAWIDSLAGPEPVPAAVPAEAPTKAESAPRDNNEFWHLISEIKASKLYLDSALALIVERAAELTGSTGAALAIGPPENMVCRATLGDAPEVGTVINPDSKLTSECIRTRNTVHVVDTDTDPRVDPFVCRDLNMRSAVLAPAFPNKGDKNFTVVLEMFSSRAKNFSAESIRKLEQLVEVAGVLALGDAANGTALQTEAMVAATRASADANESALFAQDELDHLVDRFISDLKIGGPAKPDAGKPEAKAPAFESKPADLTKSGSFETNYGGSKTDSFSTKPISEKPLPTKSFESKPLPPTESVVTAKKPEPSKKATDKSAEMEVVSLAEPVGVPFVPKRAGERADLTWGQTPEPSGSKVPVIAVAALAVISVIGGVVYFVHRSSATPKTVVEAQAAPAPVTPAADPNTSMTVTATPLPESKPSASSSAGKSEPAKKTPETKAAEKETKQNEAPKQAPEPEPIVLAAAKRATTEAPAPMAAPAITMPTGGAAPPTDIPVSTSAPQLAAQRSTGVTQGVLIHRVSPRYPAAARSYALSGEVVLKGRITKEGNVDELKAVSGNPLLAGAAMEAVRQWKYQPYKVNGNPIDMETTFRIQFDIPK
jgi:periplasmic protein TonB